MTRPALVVRIPSKQAPRPGNTRSRWPWTWFDSATWAATLRRRWATHATWAAMASSRTWGSRPAPRTSSSAIAPRSRSSLFSRRSSCWARASFTCAGFSSTTSTPAARSRATSVRW